MTASDPHAVAVRLLLDDEPVHPDDRPDVTGRLQRLCRTATRDLPASGVGVSLQSEAGDLLTAAASGPTSEQLEELQFTLGEGPCIAAYSSRLPVLVPDLAEASRTIWPGYGPAAASFGVGAVFAFPLTLGAARLGALDVYREQPGALSPWTISRALSYARVALQAMLDAQERPVEAAAWLFEIGESRFEVYQAQGMVMIQLDLPADQALARIRAHAYLQDRRIGDVADDVIGRRLVFEPDEPAP